MSAPRPCGLAAAALVLLLAGCAAPATRVVLLPQADGSSSAVVVRSGSSLAPASASASTSSASAAPAEQVLDRPFQRATARANDPAAPARDQADAATVRAQNPQLFDLMPAPAARYVVYFDTGGALLTPSSIPVLEAALATARQRAGGDIVITGHTDTRGPLLQNDELSRVRAQEVRQLFVTRGFPSARVEAAGRGERDLAVPTAQDVDEPRNRRAVIEVR